MATRRSPATLIGCSTARNKGTCDNRVNIRRDELEARVLNALRTKLVDPAMFARFCEVFTQGRSPIHVRKLANGARREKRVDDIYRPASVQRTRTAVSKPAPVASGRRVHTSRPLLILAPIRPTCQQPGNRKSAYCPLGGDIAYLPHTAWRGTTKPSSSLLREQ